jgi:uncharacterized membrane protein YfhO
MSFIRKHWVEIIILILFLIDFYYGFISMILVIVYYLLQGALLRSRLEKNGIECVGAIVESDVSHSFF